MMTIICYLSWFPAQDFEKSLAGTFCFEVPYVVTVREGAALSSRGSIKGFLQHGSLWAAWFLIGQLGDPKASVPLKSDRNFMIFSNLGLEIRQLHLFIKEITKPHLDCRGGDLLSILMGRASSQSQTCFKTTTVTSSTSWCLYDRGLFRSITSALLAFKTR